MICDNENDEEHLSHSTLKSQNYQFEPLQDWRKMFDEEMSCDITIDVDGVLIKAHKILLMYRCQYFASMFSGKAGDEINVMYLDGFSFECVHFTLCQIYSGIYAVPQSVDIFELADIADLLCLEGLKELVIDILENDYFHQFHRPCVGCIFMISKFLRWSGVIGYTEVYYKMLLWIKQYGDEIWSKKEFSQLPYHDIKNCFLHQALDISSDNVLDTIKCCDKLMQSLPRVSWTTTVFRLALQLMRKCVQFISEHLAEVLSSDDFLMIDSNSVHLMQRIKDCVMAAIEHADALQICGAYGHLHILLNTQCNYPSNWFNMLNQLAVHCEDMLITCASQAMSTSAWNTLEPELQEKIKRCSGITTVGTNSKIAQVGNKHTRERNLEKLKYLLYSELGSINRVPKHIMSQLPVATKSSNQNFVAPGNSMVTSTKFANNKNVRCSSQLAIPSCHNSAYKDVKSRYLNPKPLKSSQEIIPQIKPIDIAKKSPQIVTKIINVTNNVDKLKHSNNSNMKENVDVTKKNNYRNSMDVLRSKLPMRKPNYINMLGRLTKSVPLIKESNPIIPYVSPYRYRSFVKATNPNDTVPQINPTKIIDKLKPTQNKALVASADTKKKTAKDFVFSDTKEYKTNLRTMYNKSPILKKHSNDNSSNYSSPLSQSSQKTNSSRATSAKPNADVQLHNYQKSTIARDDKKKSTVKEIPRYNPLSKSAININTKLSKKSIFEPGQKYLIHSLTHKTNKTVPELSDRSKSTPVVNSNDVSSNDSSINFVLERSRTFIKSEPSFINKDITLDSSIEMYPQ